MYINNLLVLDLNPELTLFRLIEMFGCQKDEPWAEFLTLEVAVCMPCIRAAIDENSLT
jgi:hypothetical protein